VGAGGVTAVPVPARLALVAFGALIAQLSVVNRVGLGGVTAEVLVVVAVAAGFAGGPERGAAVGFGLGLSWDLLLSTPLGLTAFVYTVAGYVAGLVGANLIRDSRLTAYLLAVLSAPVATLVWAVIGALFGQTFLLDAPLVRIAVANIVVALAVVPVVLVAVRWAVADPYDRVRQRA
jgi:rod shape-determining protein MreD